MAAEGFDELAGGDVPEAEGLIVRGRDHETRVGGKGEVGDALVVALEGLGGGDGRRCVGVGEIKGVCADGLVGGGGAEETAVGGEFDAGDCALVAR